MMSYDDGYAQRPMKANLPKSQGTVPTTKKYGEGLHTVPETVQKIKALDKFSCQERMTFIQVDCVVFADPLLASLSHAVKSVIVSSV